MRIRPPHAGHESASVRNPALEASVLDLPATAGDRPVEPDLAKYDAFLKFRGIQVTSAKQRKPYLKWDQERWMTRKGKA